MDQMDTRFEILFKLLPLLDSSTAALPEVKKSVPPNPNPKFRTIFCYEFYPRTQPGVVQSEISVKIFKAKSKIFLR